MGITFNVPFWYEEKYLPTKRHRNLRTRAVKSSVEVEVKELKEADFPVAFIVHDFASVYEDKEYDPDKTETEYKMWKNELRAYNGELYEAWRDSWGAAISTHFMPVSTLEGALSDREPYWKGGGEFSEKSIIRESNEVERRECVLERAKDYIVYDDKVWRLVGEPMYNVMTFGLGHNHGGTGFFVTYHYNENIRKENYFNALEREKAIAYGKQIALNRGDTKSVEGMGKREIIEVLMPEMVKRNPMKDHGDGCPFLNSLEDLVSGSDSIMEAGLLCMAMTNAEAN